MTLCDLVRLVNFVPVPIFFFDVAWPWGLNAPLYHIIAAHPFLPASSHGPHTVAVHTGTPSAQIVSLVVKPHNAVPFDDVNCNF